MTENITYLHTRVVIIVHESIVKSRNNSDHLPTSQVVPENLTISFPPTLTVGHTQWNFPLTTEQSAPFLHGSVLHGSSVKGIQYQGLKKIPQAGSIQSEFPWFASREIIYFSRTTSPNFESGFSTSHQ